MYDKFGTAATTGSGIHIGMMDQQDYKKDAASHLNDTHDHYRREMAKVKDQYQREIEIAIIAD